MRIGRLSHRRQLVRVNRLGEEGILTDEVTAEVNEPDDVVMYQSLDDITLLEESSWSFEWA